jgi:hypothetical protein
MTVYGASCGTVIHGLSVNDYTYYVGPKCQ